MTDAVPCSIRVRELLRQQLALRPCGIEDVAGALSMSSRTLRRRLAKENTTFQALLDDLRRMTAIHQLESDPCCADALASMLGFGDARSFRRAFKRWTGMTPSGYRTLRANNPVSTPPPAETTEAVAVPVTGASAA